MYNLKKNLNLSEIYLVTIILILSILKDNSSTNCPNYAILQKYLTIYFLFMDLFGMYCIQSNYN